MYVLLFCPLRTVTLLTFGVGTYYLKREFSLSPTVVFDRFDEVFSLVLCIILYLKGHFRPSTNDTETSGNPLYDFYWGTELYPRILGWDIKAFTNCRFGMTSWSLLTIIAAIKSYELNGGLFPDSIVVSTLLQLAYFSKFFWWEGSYLSTLDIVTDRAGFYFCWGSLVWIPGFLTSASQYLALHPVNLGDSLLLGLLSVGLLAIALEYWCDLQRYAARRSDGRSAALLFRQPHVIRAKVRDHLGVEQSSVLLCSGFWGLARHFNYTLEIITAFLWCAPALFKHVFPYSYFIFISLLILHRSIRDEAKCRLKYGRYWEDYCSRVPYRLIPYIF